MKLPLAYSLKNRASSLAEDAKLLNGYVESRGDPKKGGLTTVEKRPALDSAFELSSGSGQALYVTNIPGADGSQSDVLGVVISDLLTRAPTAKTKRLAFGVQPSAVALNTAISPSVTVTIRDSLGNIVNSTANVTVALASNPTSATLGGTLTRAAVAGTATFNDLTLNRSGEDFTLRATGTGLNSATSNAFDIATHLTFTVQPDFALPNATMDPVEVTVQDSANATDTNYNGDITLSIYSGSGTLSGTTTVTAVSGVASFTNLSIDSLGTYKFKAAATEVATAYPPALQISNEFSIGFELTAGQIVFGGNTSYGYSISAGFGSLTPSSYNGAPIISLVTNVTLGVTGITMTGTLTQSFFTSITLGATTLTSATAGFTSLGGLSGWTWASPFVPSTGVFEVTIS